MCMHSLNIDSQSSLSFFKDLNQNNSVRGSLSTKNWDLYLPQGYYNAYKKGLS